MTTPKKINKLFQELSSCDDIHNILIYGKNQSEMVVQLKKDPNSFRDIWNGFSYESFLLSSPILAKQELPKEWKSLHDSKIQNGTAIFQTISGGDWMGINPYLLQLALDNISFTR